MKPSSSMFFGLLLLLLISSCEESQKKKEPEKKEAETVQLTEEASPQFLYVLEDLFSGERGDFVQYVFSSNGKRFFFSTYRNSTREGELWVSDGTSEGTEKVGSYGWIHSMPLVGNQKDYAYQHNGSAAITENYFYFLAGPDRNTKHLYVTDGTPEGTTQVLSDIKNSSRLFSFNNKVYLTASPGETTQVDLYEVTNDQVTQITRDGLASSILKIVEEKGAIYFVHDEGIYQWDGTELRNIINPSRHLSAMANGLEVMHDTLYFYGFQRRPPHRRGVYATSISKGGIKTLIDHPGGVQYDTNSPQMTRVGDAVFFLAPDPSATAEDFTGNNIKKVLVWKYDTTQHLTQVREFQGQKPYSPYVSMDLNDYIGAYLLIPTHYTDPENQSTGEILYSMETTTGTTKVLDTLRNEFNTYDGSKTGTHLYFGNAPKNDTSEPYQLWRTDGTPEGTMVIHQKLADLEYQFAREGGLAILGEKVFFVGSGETGKDIWVFDQAIFKDSGK